MKVGIIGGSGLYQLEDLQNIRECVLDTPFGKPSDAYVQGTLGGIDVIFLPRHGRGHRLLPSEINHRANIWGFKKLGVEGVVSVSAVGSLREGIRPRDIVLPDQYFDRTKGSSQHTFFGNGIVGHVSFGDPTCKPLREVVLKAAREAVKVLNLGDVVRIHAGGTYVNMEGPAFSTRAESNSYRRAGFDIIGMTSLPEAKLCREAELCYQSMAMATDYDCWHTGEAEVSVDMIIETLTANTKLAKEIIRRLLPGLTGDRDCACQHALKYAIMTDRRLVPPATMEALSPMLAKYQ
ncbi:MAG: S-methyl-5'-thioadenosine phosphorylase [bacterium]